MAITYSYTCQEDAHGNGVRIYTAHVPNGKSGVWKNEGSPKPTFEIHSSGSGGDISSDGIKFPGACPTGNVNITVKQPDGSTGIEVCYPG